MQSGKCLRTKEGRRKELVRSRDPDLLARQLCWRTTLVSTTNFKLVKLLIAFVEYDRQSSSS